MAISSHMEVSGKIHLCFKAAETALQATSPRAAENVTWLLCWSMLTQIVLLLYFISSFRWRNTPRRSRGTKYCNCVTKGSRFLEFPERRASLERQYACGCGGTTQR